MTLTTSQIRDYGVPFREALTRFATQDLADELLAAQAPIKPPPLDQERPILSALLQVAHAVQQPALQRLQQQEQQRVALVMQEHLQFWLETGELIGYGRQTRPTIVRARRKIHFDYWRSAQIDWQFEIAEDAAVSYRHLLIVDPQEFPDAVFFPTPGPKYFGTEIERAMEQLNLEIPNFRTTEVAHKARAALIRNRVKRNDTTINTDGRGFETDTIRRHYQRFCNQPKFKS